MLEITSSNFMFLFFQFLFFKLNNIQCGVKFKSHIFIWDKDRFPHLFRLNVNRWQEPTNTAVTVVLIWIMSNNLFVLLSMF